MGQSVTLGGERLGSGSKQNVYLKGYERSTHDLSHKWRSTMSSGTLVPFLSKVAMPGDDFDINLDVDVLTHPTIGPLFGSYKVQLDIFECPIRLYHGKLHMNALGIGLNMSSIKFPRILLKGDGTTLAEDGQINKSSIFSYLGITGLGTGVAEVERYFNGLSYIMYWDIYKNYYANKQEEIGMVIHNALGTLTNTVDTFEIFTGLGGGSALSTTQTPTSINVTSSGTAEITMNTTAEPNPHSFLVWIDTDDSGHYTPLYMDEIYGSSEWDEINQILKFTNPTTEIIGMLNWGRYAYNGGVINPSNNKPRLVSFPLENIDRMREDILTWTTNSAPFDIDANAISPYGLPMTVGSEAGSYSVLSSQEGLGIKTYQSDIFNNWINTEWLDGVNGINEITAIDTSSGEFTIDTFLLARKVYDMLNRIAVSDGTYDAWQKSVYDHDRIRSAENPMYMGGLIKELAFQEVISNSASGAIGVEQPLGTLAGRGVLTQKNKGGKITVKVDEPSYIIGIVSLTPRIDYSQGNEWDVNLETMDDLHKPALDEIGFQELITDQMAWWDTEITEVGGVYSNTYKSAGKQPAWINYMTDYNKVKGNFAVESQQQFMVLTRRYERGVNGIVDLTTYIDPSKFNHIFADTRLDAQNFWVQINIGLKARRKMSAKVMPNL